MSQGEIWGLVGPSGSGKTSAFRVLATLMDPVYGEVSLCCIDILEEPEAARLVGLGIPVTRFAAKTSSLEDILADIAGE